MGRKMKMISYIPAKDELVLKFRSRKGKPNKQLDGFKLWWDDKGNICAIAISHFTQELKEFEKRRGWIQLAGIWQGATIGEEDIREVRQEMLKKLEEKW
jgi:hypothetical protein